MRKFCVVYLALPRFLVRGNFSSGRHVNVPPPFAAQALSTCYPSADLFTLKMLRCMVEIDIPGYKNDSDYVWH